MTPEEFINKNRNVSPDALRLKFHSKGFPWLEEAITTIECLNKAGKKFNLDGHSVLPDTLVSPLSIEQSTAASIALFHSSLINKGDRILDMTMGLGMDSRAMALGGAEKVTGCELNEKLAEASRKNYAGIRNLEIVNTDSTDFLKKCAPDSFDLIFADPARRGTAGERVYNLRDCTPDLTGILPVILEKAPRLLAKISPMLDVSQTIADLPGTHILYIVDDGYECKELLADVRRESRLSPLIIIKSGDNLFAFTREDEQSSEYRFALPEPGDIIYEPSPAMMKAGPFRLISNLTAGALAPNTHLYIATDETKIPGRYFRITDIHPLNSAGVKQISKKYDKLNLAVRNFPGNVKDLVKKLKIREGGTLRAVAVTLMTNERCLLVGEPLQR